MSTWVRAFVSSGSDGPALSLSIALKPLTGNVENATLRMRIYRDLLTVDHAYRDQQDTSTPRISATCEI